MQCPTRFGLSTHTSLVLLEFEGSALSMAGGTDNDAANTAAASLKIVSGVDCERLAGRVRLDANNSGVSAPPPSPSLPRQARDRD